MEQQLPGTSLSTNDNFISPTYGQLNFSEVVGSITNYIEAQPNLNTKLSLDPIPKLKMTVTSIMSRLWPFTRRGRRRLLLAEKCRRKCFTLRERIYNEALMSLDFAKKLLSAFQVQGILELGLEFTWTLVPKGETRLIINEIVGMVRSSGF